METYGYIFSRDIYLWRSALNRYRLLTRCFLFCFVCLRVCQTRVTGSYHVVNALLHAACCALLVPLAERLLLGDGVTAALAAALFATHPIHTEAGDVLLLVVFLSFLSLLVQQGFC